MKAKKPYKPRTLIPFNTGTRAHRSGKAYRRVKRSLEEVFGPSSGTGEWQGGNTEWPAVDRE